MKVSTAISLAVAALASQVSATVPITGAQTGLSSGSVPARQNINDLFNEGGPQWSLYLRALKAFYEVDENDPESFFQIAGIHGRPVIGWDSDEEAKMQMGYCPHIDNLFLPWHRPYLALFEQTLVNHAIEIAEEYNDDEWTRAAETLRAPYWDWAEDATVPAFAGQQEIEVETPEGTESIANPLYDYHFPQSAIDGDFGQIIAGDRDKTKIVRCSPDEANERLAEIDFKGMVFQAFTRSDTFDKVASMGSADVVVAFEQPHNSIHMRAACGSHFAYTQEGAFDPLFFLHHANIDRLYALWEEMYPQERALTTPYQAAGTFAIEQGSTITGDSPMLPFVGSGNRDWTPSNVVDVTTFGYTYPDLPTGSSAEERRRQVASTVNKLYGRDSGDDNRDDTSSAASTGGVPTSAVSLSSTAEPSSTSTADEDDAARLPVSDLPASESISVPASVPTASASSASESGAGGIGGLPSATLSSGNSKPTGEPEEDEDEDKDDGGLGDLPSFGELLPGGKNGSSGLNVSDVFPPLPDDLIPDIPDLNVDIGFGIEYMIRIKINAGHIPTPSEMNVYIGDKLAGSFVVLTSPPSGCIEGEFPIRKVLDVLGLLGGLISDLIHGKIQNPIDAIKEDIHVEFVHVCVYPHSPSTFTQTIDVLTNSTARRQGCRGAAHSGPVRRLHQGPRLHPLDAPRRAAHLRQAAQDRGQGQARAQAAWQVPRAPLAWRRPPRRPLHLSPLSAGGLMGVWL